MKRAFEWTRIGWAGALCLGCNVTVGGSDSGMTAAAGEASPMETEVPSMPAAPTSGEAEATDTTDIDEEPDPEPNPFFDPQEQETDRAPMTDEPEPDPNDMTAPGPGDDCVPDYDCDPAPPDTGDPHADCVERVNQFRACACLGPLERNFEAEACMDEQAEYDSINGAHAGFSDRICMPNGNSQNECPGWRDTQQVIEGCIRMMYYEGPPPSDPCQGQCYQAHGHFINMTDTRVTSVACGFYDANGELWSVQNFFR